MERESMEFDVVIVGAGPAGLSTACRLMQNAKLGDQELTVCVVEKGSEVGAHILSGAIFETRALDELFPDWQSQGAPVNTQVTRDETHLLLNENKGIKLPNFAVPSTMHNQGNYLISSGNLCRWLGNQAEMLGVEVFPGFAARHLIIEDGELKGIVTGDMGVDEEGNPKDTYMPGMELRAKYTVFAEGCRGHLGRELIEAFNLDADADPQHYALGVKEIWEVDDNKHEPGLVVHGAGWPLDKGASGGFFLYHIDNRQVALGLIVDLNYPNPNMSPFNEMQRFKHHPTIKSYLEGGKRIAYGARAIAKGGLNCLPKMHFPGGLLVGSDAGTLNFAKIKGIHTAMKSGMIAADVIVDALAKESPAKDLKSYDSVFKASWLYQELHTARNFGAALHKYGTVLGGTFNFVDQNLFRGKLPITLHDRHHDHEQTLGDTEIQPILYPKPDGVISFDKASSVYLSSTYHEDNQLCHIVFKDREDYEMKSLVRYSKLAENLCPAGVYETTEQDGQQKLRISAQNCLHCKTCDIKDPYQELIWVTPSGGEGPSYSAM